MTSLIMLSGLFAGSLSAADNAISRPSVGIQETEIRWVVKILMAGTIAVLALRMAHEVAIVALDMIYEVVLMVKKILQEIGIPRRKPPGPRRRQSRDSHPRSHGTNAVSPNHGPANGQLQSATGKGSLTTSPARQYTGPPEAKGCTVVSPFGQITLILPSALTTIVRTPVRSAHQPEPIDHSPSRNPTSVAGPADRLLDRR